MSDPMHTAGLVAFAGVFVLPCLIAAAIVWRAEP